MNALLSIKPKYANQIMNGTKTVEFRKSIFKNSVKKVYVYSSSPEQKLIGYFTIKDFDFDEPTALWEKYNKVGGIDKKDFFLYYENKKMGVSIIIDKVVKFKVPKNPKTEIKNFTAPQSYCYLDYAI